MASTFSSRGGKGREFGLGGDFAWTLHPHGANFGGALSLEHDTGLEVAAARFP